jgi:hypothetical protein
MAICPAGDDVGVNSAPVGHGDGQKGGSGPNESHPGGAIRKEDNTANGPAGSVRSNHGMGKSHNVK